MSRLAPLFILLAVACQTDKTDKTEKTDETSKTPEPAPTNAPKTTEPAPEPPSHDEPHRPDKHASHEKHFDHRFEDAETWAKRFDDPARDAWQKPAEVVKVLGIGDGMVVADIGAGTGYFLSYFSKAVGPTGKVLGIDIEPDMVRYMNERAKRKNLANTSARQVPKDQPGLEAGSTDRIVIVNTWHHIGKRAAYTQRLRRALRPGGTVAVVDYTMEAPRGPPAAHRLSADEVVAELTEAGLVATVAKETLPHQYIVIGRLSGDDEKAARARAALTADAIALPNAAIADGALVGGQPTEAHLRAAHAAGVRTVVTLRRDGETGAAEGEALATKLGMTVVPIRIGGPADLTEANARRLDDALASARGPAVVHCASGNRVGALFAVRAQKVLGADAETALAVGKRAGLTKLEPAVKSILGL